MTLPPLLSVGGRGRGRRWWWWHAVSWLPGWLTDARSDGLEPTVCAVSPRKQSRIRGDEGRRCRGGNNPTLSRWNVSLTAFLQRLTSFTDLSSAAQLQEILLCLSLFMWKHFKWPVLGLKAALTSCLHQAQSLPHCLWERKTAGDMFVISSWVFTSSLPPLCFLSLLPLRWPVPDLPALPPLLPVFLLPPSLPVWPFLSFPSSKHLISFSETSWRTSVQQRRPLKSLDSGWNKHEVAPVSHDTSGFHRARHVTAGFKDIHAARRKSDQEAASLLARLRVCHYRRGESSRTFSDGLSSKHIQL